ncbi:LuxR C-terminal-related transcriptional regulator [Spongiactinospora sp. 9N601]|uniref:helix-turn-helix transcriptional regulator n=1 Tax=Spongiactinospora sp. 9N601 TaxID=3375149 RepID=UPI00379D7DAB
MGAKPLRVAVRADDPLSRAGLRALLRSPTPGHEAVRVIVLPDTAPERPDVAVVAATGTQVERRDVLGRAARELGAPIVLIADLLSPEDLLMVVRYQVMGVVPRASVSADLLVRGVAAVAEGSGLMSPRLAGGLLGRLHRSQLAPRDPAPDAATGFTEREIEILRLLADGRDTGEIAERLCYSPRTVKNIMYAINRRLNLRNRAHAVAYAMRAGVI